ncbi:MAG TPA: F0F1 ATP synthase subunit B [Tepidisphaeraceae bacterium]|nr:F0F1 ATP synthase subunit B [Tepidisphaeraceae bacterium]
MLKRMALSWIFLLALALGGRALAAEAAHGEDAAHGEQPGLLSPDVTAAVWTLIIFVVLLAVLYPTAWKGVLEGLRKREERIRKDIAEAEAARARAEATLKEYHAQLDAAGEKVRQMISAATTEGEKIAAEIRAKGQSEAEQAKERAVRDIDTARQHAVAELYEKAADLSTSIASKILRRNLNSDDQRDLVRQSLEQLQTVDNK